jgi:hypothetical protein
MNDLGAGNFNSKSGIGLLALLLVLGAMFAMKAFDWRASSPSAKEQSDGTLAKVSEHPMVPQKTCFHPFLKRRGSKVLGY